MSTTVMPRTTFLTYENPAYGIKIQYSSYWQRVAARINLYKSQYTDFVLTDTSQGTTSTGSPIYKIENTHSNGRLAIKTMEVWAIKGTTAFMILYNADTQNILFWRRLYRRWWIHLVLRLRQ
jgi:hypothetical protein